MKKIKIINLKLTEKLVNSEFIDILPITKKQINSNTVSKVKKWMEDENNRNLSYNDTNLTQYGKPAHRWIARLKDEDRKLYNKRMLDYAKNAKSTYNKYGYQIEQGILLMDFDKRLPEEFLEVFMKEIGVNSLIIQNTENKHKGMHIILPIDYDKINSIANSQSSKMRCKAHTIKLVANNKVFYAEYDVRGAFRNSDGYISANISVVADYTEHNDNKLHYGEFELVTLDGKETKITKPNDIFYLLNRDLSSNEEAEKELCNSLKEQFKNITISSKAEREFLTLFKEENISISVKDIVDDRKFNVHKKQTIKKRKKSNKGNKANNVSKFVGQISQSLKIQTKKYTKRLKSYYHNGYNSIEILPRVTSFNKREAENAIYGTCQLILKYSVLSENKTRLNAMIEDYAKLIFTALKFDNKLSDNKMNYLNEISKQSIIDMFNAILAQTKSFDAIHDIRISSKKYSQFNDYEAIFGQSPITSVADITKLNDTNTFEYKVSPKQIKFIDIFNSFKSAKRTDIDDNNEFKLLYEQIQKLNKNFDLNNHEIARDMFIEVSSRDEDEIAQKSIKHTSFNNSESIDDKPRTNARISVWNKVFKNHQISGENKKNSKKALAFFTKEYKKLSSEDKDKLDTEWLKYVNAYNFIIKNSYKSIIISRNNANMEFDSKFKVEFLLKYSVDLSNDAIYKVAKVNGRNAKMLAMQYKLSAIRSKGQSYNFIRLLNDNCHNNSKLIKFKSDNMIDAITNELYDTKFDYDTINNYNNKFKNQKKYALIAAFNYKFLTSILNKIVDNFLADEVNKNQISSRKELSDKLQSMSINSRFNQYLLLAQIWQLANFDDANELDILNSRERRARKFIKYITKVESSLNNNKSTKDEFEMLILMINNTVFMKSTNRVPKLGNKTIRDVLELFSLSTINWLSYNDERKKFMEEKGIKESEVNLSTEQIYKDPTIIEDQYVQEIYGYNNLSEFNKQSAEELEKEISTEGFKMSLPTSAYSIKNFEFTSDDNIVVNYINNYGLDNDMNLDLEVDDNDIIEAAIKAREMFAKRLVVFDNSKEDVYKIKKQTKLFSELQLKLFKDNLAKEAKHQYDLSKANNKITVDELLNKPARKVNKLKITLLSCDEDPYKKAKSILNFDVKNKAQKGFRDSTIYSIATILFTITNQKLSDAEKFTDLLMSRLDFLIDNLDEEFNRDKVKTIVSAVINNKYHFSNSDLNRFNYLFGTKYTNRSIFKLYNNSRVAMKKEERTKLYLDEHIHDIMSIITGNAFATMNKDGNKLIYDTKIGLSSNTTRIDLNRLKLIIDARNTRIYNDELITSVRTIKNTIKQINNFIDDCTPYDLYTLSNYYLGVLTDKDGQNTLSTKGFMHRSNLSNGVKILKDFVSAYEKVICQIHANKKRATKDLVHHSDNFVELAMKTGDRNLNRDSSHFKIKDSFWGKLSPNDFISILSISLKTKGNVLYASQMSSDELMNMLLIKLFSYVKDTNTLNQIKNIVYDIINKYYQISIPELMIIVDNKHSNNFTQKRQKIECYNKIAS